MVRSFGADGADGMMNANADCHLVERHDCVLLDEAIRVRRLAQQNVDHFVELRPFRVFHNQEELAGRLTRRAAQIGARRSEEFDELATDDRDVALTQLAVPFDARSDL